MATAPFTFTGPTFSVGWIVAFVIAVLSVIFWVMGLIPKEWAMLTIAACAVRL